MISTSTPVSTLALHYPVAPYHQHYHQPLSLHLIVIAPLKVVFAGGLRLRVMVLMMILIGHELQIQLGRLVQDLLEIIL